MALPSGTVTFLFTDIEGSTQLAQTYRKQWESLRTRHHAVLHQTVQAHDGHIFQIVGDGFCAAFHTAIDAIRAAADAQRMLFAESWDPAPIKVRMGIHSGTARLSEAEDQLGGYTGYLALARTARLMSVGHGGQVLVSLATEELVRDELSDELSLRDMGARRLKDLNRPEQIFQLIIPDLPNDFSPLKTLDAYRHNLPTQMTTFIGREKEMAEVKNAIANHRFVALTGAGGTGKTRLALQAAADLLDQFPDGVWFVELASLTDPERIPQSILATCGVPEQKGLTSMQILLDYLRDRQLLLILDNCEHLVEACARLIDVLLNHADGLKILATTREPLGIAGESDWLVPSLSLPDAKQALVIERLSQYEAVRLFIDRALLVQPHFNVTKDNAPAIAQICSRLDGIPLALELAAARVRTLSVDEIAAHLDDRFRLLTGGSRTVLPRQQTLRATIDWSYNLLTEQEKLLLRALSVFSGGWTLDAAEQVCSQIGGEWDVLELLGRLVEKSLVVMEESAGHSRYHLLETTRQYASEKLRDAHEDTETRQQHLAYYLDHAEHGNDNIHGPQQGEWMDRLENDLDNFRVALEWCVTTRATESALRLLHALGWTWIMRAHFAEMNDWFNKVRALPKVDGYPLHYSRLLIIMSFLCYFALTQDAHPLLKESEKICVGMGTEGEACLARTMLIQGMFARFENNIEEARLFTEKSLGLFRKVGDRRGEAEALMNLGFVAWDAGDAARMHSYAEQSLAIFREMGNLFGCGRSLRLLALQYLFQGDYEKALPYNKQQVEIDEKIQFVFGIHLGYTDSGEIYRYLKQPEEAERWFSKSLTLVRQRGMKYQIPFSLLGLGMCALQRDDYSSAREHFRDRFAAGRDIGEELGYAECFPIAALAAGTDQPETAARLYGAAQNSWKVIDPFDRAELERYMQLARTQLGQSKFEALVNEGRTLTPEQTLELAMKILEET